ncbi:hypothetical protein [Aeromicrobium sp. UC242_57]|uniref:hypothetical protein n=1 Tax=Aeromicrobium sp. UC242_57 TaxID=3374624 RepID=UPI0037AD364E
MAPPTPRLYGKLAHQGAGATRHLGRAITRAVVDDQDIDVRLRLDQPEIVAATVSCSFQAGTTTRTRIG